MTPPPATRASIKIVKSMPYRGGTVLWSNRYHFAGNLSPTDAQWSTIRLGVTGVEIACYTSRVTIVEAVGYDPGSEVPVWSTALSANGTLSPGGSSVDCPGDVACLMKLTTDARSTKNHPIYLFSYYHDAWHSSATVDTIDAQQKTNLEALGTKFVDGSWTDGTNTLHRCGPYGAVAQARIVSPLLTHRDFPR